MQAGEEMPRRGRNRSDQPRATPWEEEEELNALGENSNEPQALKGRAQVKALAMSQSLVKNLIHRKPGRPSPEDHVSGRTQSVVSTPWNRV